MLFIRSNSKFACVDVVVKRQEPGTLRIVESFDIFLRAECRLQKYVDHRAIQLEHINCRFKLQPGENVLVHNIRRDYTIFSETFEESKPFFVNNILTLCTPKST